MKDLVLVGNDANPSKAFEKLMAGGHSAIPIRAYLGHGKPISATKAEIADAIIGTGFVLIGMSSSRELAEMEIFAADVARENSVPFGFFSDMHGCFRREWFSPFHMSAKAVFVVSPSEVPLAHIAFPNAMIVASGNPVWEEFLEAPLSRKEVRSKLGIQDGEKVILVPLNKMLHTNVDLIKAVVFASKRRPYIRIVIGVHPGDKNGPGTYAEAAMGSETPCIILTKEQLPTSYIMSGVDVVVSASSPTTDYHAAHLRIPIVQFITNASRERIKKETGEETSALATLRAAVEVQGGLHDLVYMIGECLRQPESYARMAAVQEALFPVFPEKGAAVNAMWQTILPFLSH